MTLMLEMSGEGVYRSKLPDFMVFLDWKEIPWFWRGFESFPYALLMAIVAPSLVALVFGFLAFRSRIRGVYFSIITQAMTYAAMLLFFRNETGLGGNNGLTDFKRVCGWSLQRPATKVALYGLSVLVLAFTYLLCRGVVNSRAGAVLRGIRDTESKVRFLGFDTLRYKLFVWSLSAALCGVAGALYVPQVGIINPSELSPANSIEMVIWVAVGGRGTLVGAILGALVVNMGKSFLTAAAPEAWLFVLGTLFVLVTLWLPDGLIALRWSSVAFRKRFVWGTSKAATTAAAMSMAASPQAERSGPLSPEGRDRATTAAGDSVATDPRQTRDDGKAGRPETPGLREAG